MQNFIDINIATLGKAFDVQGTATRRQFWYFVLFTWLVGFGASFMDLFLPGNFLGDITSVLLLVPSITVAIRRMHDTDHAGWWILFPFVNFIFLITESKPNRWSSGFTI